MILTRNNVIAFILSSAMLSSLLVYSQAENKLIRQGNRLYNDQNFKEAEIEYRKSLDKNTASVPGRYNLGNSLYKQNNYQEAILSFDSVLKTNPGERVLSQAYYNMGNSLLKFSMDSADAQSNALQGSIDAYKQSLRINPLDSSAKYNLAYAQRLLQQQQQQQQQNQEQQQDKKDNEQQDQQQQEPQDQQDQQQQEQQQQQPQSREISKQDAERMLEALKNDEQNTLEKLKRQQIKSQRVTTEKDW